MKFARGVGWEGEYPFAWPAPARNPGALTPYHLPVCSLLRGSQLLSAATEAGEAPTTATVLAIHEPGFWLSGTPVM